MGYECCTMNGTSSFKLFVWLSGFVLILSCFFRGLGGYFEVYLKMIPKRTNFLSRLQLRAVSGDIIPVRYSRFQTE